MFKKPKLNKVREIKTKYEKFAKTTSEIIFLAEESPEGGYDAKALGYSIFTQAETVKKLKEEIKDAVKCHFEEKDMPCIIRIHLVKDEVIAV